MRQRTDPRNVLTPSQRIEMRRASQEYAEKLRAGTQPKIEDYISRVDPSLHELLRVELVGVMFVHEFGDAMIEGKQQYQRYNVVAELGEGAFGKVFKADDEELNRYVALKVLLKTDKESKSRFKREAQLLAQLPKHSNLVGVFDVGELPEGHSFLTMEYIDGRTLRDQLNQGPLDFEFAARLMEQIAMAVDAVHRGPTDIRNRASSPSIVHRDLKPENVLVDPNGQAHVTDFGLAAAVVDIHDGTAVSGGTRPYMSPEQATAFRSGRSWASVDTRSDVWAMGVMLYEMLSGKQPFVSHKSVSRDKANEDIIDKILNYEPTQLSDLRPEIPRELHELVSECLKKSVTERVQSAAEVAKRLRNWLDSVSAIPAPLNFSARVDEARKDFTDRPWLFDEVDAWPEHLNERLLLIVGELGSGKSAFLAEFIHRKEKQVLAMHLCRHDWPKSRSAATFVQSLAAMLAAKLESYRAAFTSLDLHQTLSKENCEKNTIGAFQATIVDLLANVAPPDDATYFLVVDALDEADNSSEVTIPRLLSTWERQLPSWLRIVASTRRGVINPNLFSGVRTLDMDYAACRPEEVKEDLLRFLRHRLSQPNFAERLQQSGLSAEVAAQTLLKKSESSFIYVVEALIAIERDRYSFQKLEQIPHGLHKIYSDSFRRQWPNDGKFANVRPILEVLIASLEPPSEDLLGTATSMDTYRLGEGLEQLRQYLDERDGKVGLKQKALSEWLIGAPLLHRIFPDKGHRRIADACWNEFDEYKAGSREVSSYCVKHLPAHLVRCRKLKQLANVLTDIIFLEKKVCNGLLFDLLRDCREALECLPRTNAGRKSIVEIAEVLTLNGAFLEKHPDHVFQCLINATAPMWEDVGCQERTQSPLSHLVTQWLGETLPDRPWVRVAIRSQSNLVPTFQFHTSSITAITARAIVNMNSDNSDCEILVSASIDGSIVLWDSTGRRLDDTNFGFNSHIATSRELPIRVVARSTHHITTAAWTTGRTPSLVFGDTKGTVACIRMLQNTKMFENEPEHVMRGLPTDEFPVAVNCVAVSSSGGRVCAIFDSGKGFLHENGTIASLSDLDEFPYTSAAFWPTDEQFLVTATAYGQVRKFHRCEDTTSWTESLGAGVTSMVFSPNGRLLWCLTNNGQLIPFDVSPNCDIEPRSPIELSINSTPIALSVSHDGKQIAVVTRNGELLLTTVTISGSVSSQRLSGLTNATCVTSSRMNGAAFYVGTRSGQVLLIDATVRTSILPSITWTGVGLNGDVLAVASDNAIESFELCEGGMGANRLSRIRSFATRVVGGCFYNDDRNVAVATATDEILVISPGRDAAPQRFRIHGMFAGIGGAPHSPQLALLEQLKPESILSVAGVDQKLVPFKPNTNVNEQGFVSVWRTAEHTINVTSLELKWRPRCVAWSEDGAIMAVGGQDAKLFRTAPALEPYGISLLEWLKSHRPELLENSHLDEGWVAEDGVDLFPSGEFTTTSLGISSVALSHNASHLALGFRSNSVAVLPVSGLQSGDAQLEIYRVPLDLGAYGIRHIVDLLFSADACELAIRQANGNGIIVSRVTKEWRSIGCCACLGGWVFDLSVGLFLDRRLIIKKSAGRPISSTSHTELRCLRTQQSLAFLPEPMELIAVGAAKGQMIVQTRCTRKPSVIVINQEASFRRSSPFA